MRIKLTMFNGGVGHLVHWHKKDPDEHGDHVHYNDDHNQEVAEQFGKSSRLKNTCVYGGAPKGKQVCHIVSCGTLKMVQR